MAISKQAIIEVKRLTPGDGHYFYGYYDTPAWSGNDRYHLVHRVDFMDRIPGADDVAEIGILDTESGLFRKVAETTAWNFQQGAMLQWHPAAPDEQILYNIRVGETFRGVVHNIRTGTRHVLERAITNVDPMGKYALSVSFPRMFDFRPGYGYAGVKDPFFHDPHPKEDGVFRIDLATGQARLIASLEQIWAFSKAGFRGADHKIGINHISFNTDGSRFMCMSRTFPVPGSPWRTALITMNADGSEPFLLADYSAASHYHWRDPDHLLIYALGTGHERDGMQLYVLKDRTNEVELVDRDFFRKDGHCSYSPDRQSILYDSYPDAEDRQHLYVYHLAARNGCELASFPASRSVSGDYRCDLHPRWSRSGRMMSFDSTHEGRRQVYIGKLQL